MLGEDLEESIVDYLLCFTALASIMMGLSFFVSRLAAERESGLRHLTHVSGLSRVAFWAAMIFVEGLLQGLMEATLMVLIGGLVLQVRVVKETSTLLVMVSLASVVASTVLLGCILHMVFRSQRASNVVATSLAVVLSIAASVFSASHPLVPTERLTWWVMVCPVMTSFQAFWTLAQACSILGGNQCLQLQDLNDGPIYSPIEMLFGTPRAAEATLGAGLFSLLMAVFVQHLFLWPLVFMADLVYYRPLRRHRNGGEAEDPGSRASNPNAALEIKQLVHWYGFFAGLSSQLQKVADVPKVLDGVSFCIEPGAMLGLLGPNGAGKTTTIRCITGEEVARKGEVVLNSQGGFSVASGSARFGTATPGGLEYFTPINGEFSQREPSELSHTEAGELLGGAAMQRLRQCAGAFLGLCPQESALNPDLSVEDHLAFFARLRDVAQPEAVAARFLRAIRLEHRRTAVPDELSGGMRRRLAVGCSMVGHPALALLDEPTTGLDPVARREIWTAIMDARDSGTACLLTTHMLEEAEELCTHIVILSQGRVAAEGSVQQLKDAWSTGYMLHVDAKAGEEHRVKQYVASLLPDHYKTPVKTSLHGQMIFNVSKDAEFVGHLFLQLAKGAAEHGIRHWGISQASLEDAYIRIIGGAGGR